MGHCAPGSRSIPSASFIFTCICALRASLACPEHPGSLEIAAKTFAAVTYDAAAPCSVNSVVAKNITNNVPLWVQLDHYILEMSCPILSFSDDMNPWALTSELVCLLSSLDVSLQVYYVPLFHARQGAFAISSFFVNCTIFFRDVHCLRYWNQLVNSTKRSHRHITVLGNMTLMLPAFACFRANPLRFQSAFSVIIYCAWSVQCFFWILPHSFAINRSMLWSSSFHCPERLFTGAALQGIAGSLLRSSMCLASFILASNPSSYDGM